MEAGQRIVLIPVSNGGYIVSFNHLVLTLKMAKGGGGVENVRKLRRSGKFIFIYKFNK